LGGSFARGIVVAIALLVAFYVAALAVALGALALAVLQWTTGLPQNIWLTLACVVTGGTILWSIAPRRRPFVPPGPELPESRAPEVHRLVAEVAHAAEQRPPEQIYLAPDVNAAVLQAGGLLGIGGRRVMLIGLPLMDVLTVRELRAVIAHEFGHFHGGDTRLGPWFFRTYDALERTVLNLHEVESIWRKPFTWYFDFFLRRTGRLKRRQEFLADELAAAIAGRDAAMASLNAVAMAAPAFDGYWSAEALPVLDSGHRIPLLEGFRRFRAAPAVADALREMLVARKEVEVDPYDTHPPLGERLAALERLPAGAVPAAGGNDPPALSLVEDVDALELDLLSALASEEAARELKHISWDGVPERVMVPGWRSFVDPDLSRLAGITAAAIPDHFEIRKVQKLAARFIKESDRALEFDIQRGYAAALLGTALGLALHDTGWRVVAPVGEPVACERGGQRIEPIADVERVAEGELPAADWRARCEELGIAELALDRQATYPEAVA
jgi:heat shock protein HtpX